MFQENGLSQLTKYQYLDIKTFLADNNLVRVDSMSMANSLEVRLPFLDIDVVEAGLRLDPHERIRRFNTKVALRKIMKGRLPSKILRMKKRGFAVPLSFWFRGPLKEFVKETLASERVKATGIICPERVSRNCERSFVRTGESEPADLEPYLLFNMVRRIRGQKILMIDLIAFISLFFIAYTYFGYPALLIIWPKRKEAISKHSDYKPTVTVLIAAFNEEAGIEKTIRSFLESHYPSDKLEVIICSDASTDRTDEIARSFRDKGVKLHRMISRGGKFEAQKEAFKFAHGEIILLADASGQFDSDAIRTLMRHFTDATVGSSVGRKIIKKAGTSVAKGDGLYWRYESKLRHLESLTGASWIGCEGGITAIRKNLLSFDYKSWFAQDYALCCRVFEKGYRNLYEPEAVVYEAPTKDIFFEFSRKIRVIVRGIQAFFAFGYLLDPIKHRMFFFQNMSHRLLRWLVPFFLIFFLIFSGLSENAFLKVLFFGQSVFYSMAIFAGLLHLLYRKNHFLLFFLFIPLYFTSMNLAALFSWMFLFKKFEMWKRTEREQAN